MCKNRKLILKSECSATFFAATQKKKHKAQILERNTFASAADIHHAICLVVKCSNLKDVNIDISSIEI